MYARQRLSSVVCMRTIRFDRRADQNGTEMPSCIARRCGSRNLACRWGSCRPLWDSCFHLLRIDHPPMFTDHPPSARLATPGAEGHLRAPRGRNGGSGSSRGASWDGSRDCRRPGGLGPNRARGAAHRRRSGAGAEGDPAALPEPLQPRLEGLSHRRGVLLTGPDQ